MYPLFETIKIENGAPQRLEWHQRRMDYAFHMLFGTNNPFRLQEIIHVKDPFRSGTVKCRFLYDRNNFDYIYNVYEPRKIKSLQLVTDNTIDYSHKYTNRSMLDHLLERKKDADDILIVRDGLVTDTSFSNIVFFDGNSWYTPDEPLLEGTARNSLLAEGKISLARIQAEDLKIYQYFRLINAMLDFQNQKNIEIKNIFFS